MTIVTFSAAAGADDGFVEQSGATYSPTTTQAVNMTDVRIGVSRGLFGNYYITNGLVRWDTSSIPSNAVITSAIVRGYITRLENFNTRNLTADYYAWVGTIADYSATALSTACSVAISTLTLNADNDIPLTNPNTNINLAGYTSLRFHIDGGVPTAAPGTGISNAIDFVSYEHATLTEMRLIVTYTPPDTTPPAAPTGLTATVLGV